MYVHQNLALIIVKAKIKAQTLRINFPQAEIKFTSLTHTIKCKNIEQVCGKRKREGFWEKKNNIKH